jgi:hypothetical protein
MAKRHIAQLVAGLLGIGSVLSAGPGMAYAHSGSAAQPVLSRDITDLSARQERQPDSITPLFTCPSSAGCVFPNTGYTGSYPHWNGPGLLNAQDAADSVWYTFSDLYMSSPNPGSITNKTGGCIYIYSKSLSQLDWIANGSRLNTYNDYGYVQARYSDSGCTHHPSPPS